MIEKINKNTWTIEQVLRKMVGLSIVSYKFVMDPRVKQNTHIITISLAPDRPCESIVVSMTTSCLTPDTVKINIKFIHIGVFKAWEYMQSIKDFLVQVVDANMEFTKKRESDGDEFDIVIRDQIK